MPLKVVQPPGTLRFVPESKKDLVAFAKTHKLRNEYFRDMLNGGRNETNGWQRIQNVRWLRHINTGEYVVVVGGPKRFLDTVAKMRSDMPFTLCNFELLLAGKYVSGSGTTSVTQHGWRLMPPGFQPRQVAALGDGSSLAGLSACEKGLSFLVEPNQVRVFHCMADGG